MCNQYIEKKSLFIQKFDTIEDIVKLPYVLTKDDLRNLYPFKYNFVEKSEIYEYHESFGTTGKPSAGPLTKKDFNNYIEEILLSPVNFNKQDVVLIRYPYAISVPAHIFHRAAHRRNAMVIPCSSRTLVSPYPRVISLLKELEVSVFCCMPSEAINLATFAQFMGYGIKSDFKNLRAICTAGELLTPSMKKYIEDLWNVEVYNFYGSTEAGNIAYSCKNGNLHIADNFFNIDIVNIEENKKNKFNQLGNIILTSKNKEALPLLKYHTEDIGYIEKQCDCGKKGHILYHYGRMSDFYFINEKKIYFRNIKDCMFDIINKHNLSPFWRAFKENNRIRIEIESDVSLGFLDLEIIDRISCDIIVNNVPKNSIFDIDKMSEIVPVKKPEYFYQ